MTEASRLDRFGDKDARGKPIIKSWCYLCGSESHRYGEEHEGPIERDCERCGKRFTPTVSRTFCSRACRR